MSPAFSLLIWASFPFLSFVEIFGACLLFAWHQPHRDRFVARCAAVVATFALVALCVAWLPLRFDMPTNPQELPGSAPTASSAAAILAQTAGFGVFLVAMLPALVFCLDMGWWSALFCAIAGYALQNFGSGMGELVALVCSVMGSPLPAGSAGIVGLLCCMLTFVAAYRPLVRDVSHADLDAVANHALLPMLAVVIFVVIGFDVVLKTDSLDTVRPSVAIMMRVFYEVFCLFTLFMVLDMVVLRQMGIEVAAAQRLMAEHERQLQLSVDTIDAINLKCHDLRHQIRHLADGGTTVDATVLADAARAVSVYDSVVRTGNQALDTILTEKRLLAEQSQVTLTCVADGEALSFMAPADLYALFGNALDNALEATSRIDDPERRSISLLVRQRAGMAQIHLENTCAAPVTLVDGLPQTSKLASDGRPDTANHGFGTRSMRSIVERYGGTLTYTPAATTFSLDAMVPIAKPA